MHTDDATWILFGQNHAKDVVGEWAKEQGRIWAYVSGSFMLYTLKAQGTIWGEVLRLGSFVLFFMSFFFYLSRLAGNRFALLSASIFTAFFAVKWDGSILVTYPLLTWVAATAFIASLYLARQYVQTGRRGFLIFSIFLFLFSLFNHEGVTVLFVLLFLSHAVFLNHQFDNSSVVVGVRKLQIRHRGASVFLGFFIASLTYVALYIAWKHFHPSIYDGHVVTAFDLHRFVTTLFHFSMSGSALFEFFFPYVLAFNDPVSGSSETITYYLTRNLQRSLHQPIAFAACCITLFLFYTAISSKAKEQKSVLSLRGVVFVGLTIAILPIVPVALTAKYQAWVMEGQARAYSHTIFSHFGWSCVYAAGILGLFNYLQNAAVIRKLAMIIVLGFSGLLAAQAFTANDDKAADMRLEARRWKTVEEIVEINRDFFHASKILSPRLNSGSRFTPLWPSYWSDYADAKWNEKISILSVGADLDEQLDNVALHDANYDKIARSFVALMTSAPQHAGEDTRILVYLEHGISSQTDTYVVQFKNLRGEAQQIRVNQQKLDMQHPNWIVIQRADVIPSSVRLTRLDEKNQIRELCAFHSKVGVKIRISDRHANANKNEELYFHNAQNRYTGWHSAELNGMWSSQPVAHLSIPHSALKDGDTTLRFEMSTLVSMGAQGETQTVSVQVQNQSLGEWTFLNTDIPKDMLIVVPEHLRNQAKGIDLNLLVSNVLSPAKLKMNQDSRGLGVYLHAIEISH
nr:hypothetical protein [uncultured Undibacterium sp.]